MTPEMAVLLEDELASVEQRVAVLEAFVASVAERAEPDLSREARRLLEGRRVEGALGMPGEKR